MSDEKTIGDRVVLRRYTLDDAEALYRALDADRATIGRFMLWVRKVDSVEKAHEAIAGWLKENEEHDSVTLAIDRRGELVGTVFQCHPCRDHLNVEIGYWLTEAARGEGIATRATEALLDLTFGEMGFHRASLKIAPQNEASIAIAERMGLEKEGVLRDFWQLEPGVWTDCVVYATTADRWAARKDGAS
ncbi:MAG: GNAT family protein [Planctomycetota bacterium]